MEGYLTQRRQDAKDAEDTEGERCKRPRGPGGATPWALRALRSAPRLGPRDLRSRVPCATLRSPGQLPGAQGITSVVEGKNKTQSAQDRPAQSVPDEPGAKRTGRRAGEERGRGAPEAVKRPGRHLHTSRRLCGSLVLIRMISVRA